jgi:hypothetical protein
MTARFLLHLRKWEAKHTAFATAKSQSAGDNSTAMDFVTNVSHRPTRSMLNMDEFGEDPVHRARATSVDLLSMGEIVETRRSLSDD